MLRALGLLCRVLRLRFVPTLTILMLASGVAGQAFAATCTVSSTADTTDPGTLRSCISGASSGDTIDFSVTGTITLTSALPTISQDLTITGLGANLLTVSGNNAYSVFKITSGTVNISGLTIANGKNSSSYSGAGILNEGNLTVTDSAFSGNSATGTYNGGGILNYSTNPGTGTVTATLTVTDSTFSGNSAADAGGGGILNLSLAGGSGNTTATLTVTNSTFSGNSASGADDGGGIHNISIGGGSGTATATLTVTNSTFSGNSASGGNSGGGIENLILSNGSLTVTNSILTGDAGGECSSLNGGCPTNGSNGNIVGVSANLLPLGYYGGPTQTMLPLPGSAAICSGSASSVPAYVTTDQRGFPLSASNCSNGGVDAGAVQTNYLTVTTNADSGAGSLRDAITTANNTALPSPSTGNGGDIAFSAAAFNASNTAAQDTITLASSLPSLAGQINVVGPGALAGGSSASAIVSGNNSSTVGSVFTVNSGAAVLLDGLTIANGNAVNDAGGGILNDGTLTVMDSTVSGNTDAGLGFGGNGGGIGNDRGSTLIVTNSTISGNTAAAGDVGAPTPGNGGGIYNVGTLVVTNSTISGNTAAGRSPGQGDGIYNNSGSLTVINSTIYGNPSPGSGSDLTNEGGMTVTNSIVGTCNYGSLCPANGDNNNVVGVANLGPLANNGGPTQTLLPLPGSAAICAGSASLFVDPTGTLLTTDQRGATHSAAYCSAGQVDAGAVQTDYTSIQFTNARAEGLDGTYIATAGMAANNPAPIVSVTEDGQNIGGVPILLTDTGSFNNTVTGLGPVTTVAGTGATFGSLEDSISEDTTLSSTLPITSTYSLTTSSNPAFSVSPSITGITPDSGPSAGGTPVTITGTGFSPGALVQFDGVDATNVVVVNSTTLTATTPAGTGLVFVQVLSSGILSNQFNFTYIAPPAFSSANSTLSASPTTLVVGSVATITATAIDTLGAPISGATVDFSFGGTTATTDSNGIASFGLDSLSPATFSVGATLVSPAGTFAQTAQVTFVAPAYVVTTLADDATGVASNCVDPNISPVGNGNCSLRDAIAAANALTGVSTAISFAPALTANATTANPAVLTLAGTGGTLTLSQNATITGPGANLLTISGGGSSSNFSVFTVNSGVTASITNLTIANGHTNSEGGGIDNLGTLTVSNTTFSNNYAGGYITGGGNGGGAIISAGTLTVVGSTFTGNSSAPGGAIAVGTGTLAINSSTFTGNSVSGTYAGGAIFFNGGTTGTITNSTFSGNSAGPGELGGIFTRGTLSISNSILSGNNNGDCGAGGTATCPVNGTNGNIVGGTADLAPLGNYGGPTQTMLPLPGSPAICAGALTSGQVLDSNGNPLTIDQRGNPRTTSYSGTACADAGAAQTNYSLQFSTQPSTAAQSEAMSPAPAVTLDESGVAFVGTPVAIPLTLTTNPVTSAALSVASATTVATVGGTPGTGIATYTGESVNLAGTGDTLNASLALNSAAANNPTISVVSSAFDVTPPLAATTSIGSTTLTYYQLATPFTPVTGSGGATPFVYSVSPMLPAGLSINASTGAITGTPMAASAATGYTVTVTDANSAAATAGFSLAVAQQASATVVSASPSTVTPVQSVTLTATVSPTISGTPIISDGTVTFYDNGTPLGTATNVSGGVAQLIISLPPGATAMITAMYSGDTNFLTSTSTSSASVTVAPLDFTFTNTGTSAYTAAPGAVASYSFGLSPLYGSYAGPVSFTVTGLPAGATATFTPSTIAANTSTTTTVTMTVQTAAAIAHNQKGNSPFGRGAVLALLLLPFGMKRSLRKKLKGRMLLLVLLLAGTTAAVTGCGSNNGFMLQSPGTYTLTVTATGGALTHTQIVTLIVQ